MLKRVMFKRSLFIFLLVLFLLPLGSAHPFETKGQDCAKCHTLGNDEARELLKGIIPDAKIMEIRISPVKAVWEIFLETRGKKALAYVDFSKKYLIHGPIVSINEKKDLSRERLIELSKIDVSQIPLQDALIMGSSEAVTRVIAFTDPE
jgi:thiol:disulfide interchange protein DsbC